MKYTPMNPEEDAIKILPMQIFFYGGKRRKQKL